MVEPTGDVNSCLQFLRELAGNIQTEAGPTGLAGAVVFGSVKPVEYLIEVAFADTDTGVLDAESHVCLLATNHQGDRTPGSVFYRIGDKVLQKLF